MDLLSDVLSTLRLQGRLYFGDTLSPPWKLDLPANDNMLKLHFVASGECRIDTGEGFREFPSGGLAILPSHISHSMKSADSETPTRLVCGEFSFDGRLRHPLVEQLPAIVLEGCGDCSESIWLQQAMNLLREETARLEPGHDALVQRLLEIVLIQALRHFVDQGGHGSKFLQGMNDPAISRSLAAVHANPSSNWRVDTLADVAALSRTAFATRFQRVMGESPMQYLTQWRMLLASQLLRQPKSSITQVAHAVGYESEASFSKVFKKTVGETPGRFRKTAVE
ncbi:MAG: AraC family transcriptional regulator [Pseudomonadota bacterium]